MSNLNQTPSANRVHIGFFGKTNSGKSSLMNTFSGHEISIVSEQVGTTTDPVKKAMEILPLGPCVLIDTAGLADHSELGQKRMEKTHQAAEQVDIAVIVLDASKEQKLEDFKEEIAIAKAFQEKKTPYLLVFNKMDEVTEDRKEAVEALKETLEKETKAEVVLFSAKEAKNQQKEIDVFKEKLVRLLPENYGEQEITGSLVGKDDLVILVMPQDIQAPKGRLILPQVQTIRELLDKKCLCLCVTTDQLDLMLSKLNQPPKLIITDSQVFKTVYEKKPKETMLTSFSVLFAAYKGDLPYYVESAKKLDALTEESKVLIAECCTHAPLTEDIGREKIPRMLRKRVGEGIQIDMVHGTDFPEDLDRYDLVIQCGACMFNRKYVMSRVARAKEKQVAMTNYGVVIAHFTGILDKISY